MEQKNSHTMRVLIITLFLFLYMKAPAQQRFFLYPPAQEGVTHKGFDTIAPFMDYYPARNGVTGRPAVLICPGGAYMHLAWDKEGTLPALFFNEQGIDAFVLHYRLNNDRQEGHQYPAQYNDVTTALRMIRSKAAEWGINPGKTGVMGFSAGGHLASTAGTILQKDTRPSFLILIYPVITMDDEYTHKKSREMVAGPHPDPALLQALSTEKRITPQTPPTFLVHADNDRAVPPQNSLWFYEALKKNQVPASLMIYDHGGHGFGMAPGDTVLNQWPKLCVQWMARLGFR
ncbi:MAG: alpha/beta hydrolase [Chitinophagaceae bacterium]